MTFPSAPDREPILFGQKLCFLPCQISLDGLRVLRAGWEWGVCKGARFEPDHALALTLRASEVASCELTDPRLPDRAVEAWLAGEALTLPDDVKPPRGWLAVTTHSFPLGWAKHTDNILKNHYPKGLRVR